MVYVSPQIETFLGYRAVDLIGDSERWSNIVHPEDRERVLEEVARAGEAGEPLNTEYRILTGNGRCVRVKDAATVARDEEGYPRFLQGAIFDVAECKASEEEMIKTGERFRSAFENASTGAALLDLDNRYLLVNRAFCGMLGYPEEELLSKKSFEITHPEDLDASRRRTERLFSGEIEMMSLEKRYLRKDAQVVWAISGVSLMRDLEGKPDYFIAHYQDITERKRIEGELREAEARNRVMLDASPDLMFLINRAGEFLDFEAQDDELYVPPEKIVGSRLRDVMPAEMTDTALNHIGRALDSSEIQVFEYRLPAPEGPRDFEARLVVSGTDEVLAVVRDLTERKRVETALKESEQHHRRQARELSLLHQVRTALAQELDLPVVFRAVVEAIADTYGYAQVSAYLLDDEELMLQHQVGYEHVIERVHISEGVMGRVARSGQSVLLEDVRDDPAFLGAIEGLVSEVCVPLFDEGGVVGVLNVESTDDVELTEDDLRLMNALGEHVGISIGRARLYTRVRESEERFRSLVQNASDAISILAADSTIIYDSPAIERTLGYKPVERIGTKAFDYVHPEDLAFAERTFSEVLNNPGVGLPIEYRLRHKDGSWRYFEAIRTNLLDDPAVEGVVLNYRDITERRRAEMRLEESEQRYKSLYEHNPDTVYSFDLAGNFLSANPACETLTDYTAEELMGRPFAPLVVPEDLERTLRHFEKAANGEPQNYEIAINHKRGNRIELNVTNLPIIVKGEIVGVYGIAKDITERKQVEQIRDRLSAIVESSEDAITSRTRDGVITSWNKGAEKLYGYTAEEVIGRSGSFMYPPEHPREMSEILEKIQRGESIDHYETVRMTKSGRRVSVSLSLSPIRDASGNIVGDSGIARDITERKRTEEALRESEERYRAVIEQSAEAIWLFDPDTKRVLESNTSFQELLGYTAEELREMTNYDFVAHSREDIDALVQFKVLEGKSLPSERKYRRKDGTLLDVEVGGAMISYQSKRVVCSVARDLTERKALEERLTHQAFHDPLTELPNRALFLDRLQHALASAGRQMSSIAVLYVDLDNFKIINDSLGHEAGDRVLVEAGRRLRSCLRPADTVARLGGDEFIALLENNAGVREATWISERILEKFRGPLFLEEQETLITPSIGILVAGPDSRPEEILRNADLAMYRAKEKGKAQYEVFDLAMHDRTLERLKLEADLKQGVERDELRVYYQPKVRLDTGKIIGMEALARWDRPGLGIVLPEEFIPVAEETGLIIPLGQWILKEACRQGREWQEQYPEDPPLKVCVNLSARQFQRHDSVKEVAGVLKETGLDPRSLILEITESVIMDEAESSIAILEELKDLGVQLAIDDFGTGYSSLSYLNRFPVDFLKIDRSFVEGLPESSEDTAVVSSIIALAHTLGMQVIAEGVETDQQLPQLRKIGCDIAQGHYFSKALTHDALSAFLRTNPHW
jgi:diguanylate cyclase (GGDEF)-like protein/PAS domain S-box-containing protein